MESKDIITNFEIKKKQLMAEQNANHLSGDNSIFALNSYFENQAKIERLDFAIKQLKKEVKKMSMGIIKDCKNLEESYGQICVLCNKCGRFDKKILTKDQRIAELKKEVEGLNTKLKIWNRFNSEDYMHKGEDVTDRDYYYYTNGASSVLENDLKYYKQENEKLKQQLAEKNKLLKNPIVPKFKVGDVLWYIRCDKVEKFIVYEARCDCVFYYVNEYGVDVDEYKLFATKQEAEEALKKLNKE